MFESYSLWDKLASSEKPIFLYGSGNGGDKIIAALDSYGVRLTGVFASDGFVRDRYYHDFHVKAYSDVVKEYGEDIIVMLAFGTVLPEVINFIENLNKRHELIIPDVPLYGGDLFDMKYFLSRKEKIESVLELFSDELSRNIFTDTINFRLTGKYEYLARTEDMKKTLSELFAGKIISSVLDGGAFKGDSTEIFVEAFLPEKIIAVEADPKTFLKLKKYSDNENRSKIIPVNAALWRSDGILEYTSSGSRGSGESGRNRRAKNTCVNSAAIDSLIGGEEVDLIKLDIEGAESEALDGASEVLRRCQPDLAVSMYHRTDDILVLTQRVHEALPAHKLYLRRIPCIPMWDLTLYAIK